MASSWLPRNQLPDPVLTSLRSPSTDGTHLPSTKRRYHASLRVPFHPWRRRDHPRNHAPLTLYVPPMRSLSFFVEAMEVVCRDCGPYSHGVVAHFRRGLSRVLGGLVRALR
uniref:Uncharacterized protein n=1 Tax=Zea mays TaxID=4577 RepID=A0A804MVG3_MAIZE